MTTFTKVQQNFGYDKYQMLDVAPTTSLREIINSGAAVTKFVQGVDGQAGSGKEKQAFAFGTSDGTDTLATLRVANQVIADYGLDTVDAAVNGLLEAYNRLTAELISQFCDISGDRQRRYGTPAQMSMQPMDNYAVPFAQGVTSGYTVGFPLWRAGIGLQWNRHYFETATTRELAMQLTALLTADAKWIQAQVKDAMFSPTSYAFQDFQTDGALLLVKALANAETGLQLPVGPQGEIFASTHNHFMYPGSGNGDTLATYTSNAWNAAPTTGTMTADVQNLIENVLEHYNDPTAKIKLYINRAQETQMRQLAPVFQPLYDPRVIHSITQDIARGALDVGSIADRAIGLFYGAEVWVKPYIPNGYMFCFLEGGGVEPSMMIRVPVGAKTEGTAASGQVTLQGGDLRIVSEFQMFPMYAQAAERRIGVGVWNRVNGSAMYLNSTTAYTNPAPFTF